MYFINYQDLASVQCQSSHYTDTTPHYTRFASVHPPLGTETSELLQWHKHVAATPV